MKKQFPTSPDSLARICARHRAYSKKSAKKHAAGLAQKTGQKFDAFKCRHCKLFHVGRPSKTPLGIGLPK